MAKQTGGLNPSQLMGGFHPGMVLAHIEDTTARATFGRKRGNKLRIAGSIVVIVVCCAVILATLAMPR